MMRVIAVLVAAWLVQAPAHADELKAIRTITVNGLAKNKVVPDEAHITVNLNARDFQLGKAKQMHDNKLRKLMALVAEYRIDAKKVSTQSSNVQPIYAYERDPTTGDSKQVFKGYRVQTTVDVTVEDISKIAKLMDSVSQAGFDKGQPPEWGQLMSLYYTLSNPEKIQEEMLVQAIKNARAKADKMADAADAKVARVFQINEGSGFNYNPRPIPMMATMQQSAGAAIAPPAGEQDVQSTVTVTYELE